MKTVYKSPSDYTKAVQEYYSYQLPDIIEEFIEELSSEDSLDSRLKFYNRYTQELTELFSKKTIHVYPEDMGQDTTRLCTIGKVYLRGYSKDNRPDHLVSIPLKDTQLELVCRVLLVRSKGHSYVARGYLCTSEYLLKDLSPVALTEMTPGGHLKKLVEV